MFYCSQSKGSEVNVSVLESTGIWDLEWVQKIREQTK